MNYFLIRHRVLFFTILFIITQIFSIRAGKYFTYVSLIFFISLFIFLKPKFNKYILFGFMLSFLLIVTGIFNGNRFVNILEDFLIFTPILSSFLIDKNLFLELEKKLMKYLVKSLFFLLPFGILIYIYMDYNFTDIGLSRFNFNEDILLEYFSPIIPFLFAPYLVFYFNSFNKNEKIILIAALFFIAFMGLITISRSLYLNLFIPFILYFTHNLITGKIGIIKIFTILLFLLFLLFLLNYLFSNNPIINGLISLLESRNESQLDSGNITSDRYSELDQYLKQNLSILDYILGRGFGGEKILSPNSSFIGGITMMHIGAAHVFLKGGILLLLYIYLPIIFLIFYYIKNKYYNTSYLLIWFLLANTITTNWNLSYSFLFYSLSISFLFNKIRFKK